MKKKIFIVMIALITTVGIGTSYSYLKAENGSTENNNIVLSNFGVILLTDINGNVLNKTYPMQDIEGLTNQSTTFQIKNTGEILANYKVSLVDKDIISTLENSDIRYQLKRTDSKTGKVETYSITNLASDGILDEGSIDVNQIYTYELIMWIDYKANPQGKTFNKAVLVEGMQSSNLDQSGANYPELADNMIPVYYDKISDTEGVWRKADSKNLNENYKWFDYNDFMWANAVTVKSYSTQTSLTLSGNVITDCIGYDGICTRDDYLNAPEGTIIPMDDITTMWVWIPRYKYTIFNGNNETSEEQLIKVSFEHGIDKTGTVTCEDKILNNSDSSLSEICKDTTYGSIVNGKSTYTHPAFTFGSEELTGIWVAKFQMSTTNTTCLNSKNETNCNKNTLGILVKPNTDVLNYQNLANAFINIRNMENMNNIHGFSQANDAKEADATGLLNNDSNNLDIHLQKNMDWGAITYLSQSKYGKWSNPLYSNDSRRVYKNNYYSSTNNRYITGYSCGSYSCWSSTTNNYQYNDMTISSTGQGYRGAGSSTTGTVYGIYDMNGAASEYVMGNTVSSTGSFTVSKAGVWDSNYSPIDKYYDKYSYNSKETPHSQLSMARGKLGDATKELMTNFETARAWTDDNNHYFPDRYSAWFVRGGVANKATQSGIVYMNNEYWINSDEVGYRPVLTVSREFPWLSE